MEFAWDPEKSEECLRSRGFDFAFAARIFFGTTVTVPDQRRDYGEERHIALGMVEGLLLTVVFTDRWISGTALERRLISARRSNRRERQAYWEAIGVRGAGPEA